MISSPQWPVLICPVKLLIGSFWYSKQRPPVNRGHLCYSLWLTLVDRFDCTCIIMIAAWSRNQMCIFFIFNTLMHGIVDEHWPETHEFITWTVELWNRWIRLSCYYNRVHMSIVYTCITYIGPCYVFGRVWSIFVYNITTHIFTILYIFLPCSTAFKPPYTYHIHQHFRSFT